MINITTIDGNAVELEAGGKITHRDYERTLPEFRRVLDEHGSISFLIETRGIESIEPRAILDDLKFDIRHAGEIDRLAVVSPDGWETWLTRAVGAIVPGVDVRCFNAAERGQAARWVRGE